MECEHIPYVTEESLNDKKVIETEATVASSSVMEEEEPAASLPPAGARPAEGGEPAHVLRQAAAYPLQRFLAHLQCRFVKVYHGHRILLLQNFNGH